MKRQKKLIPTPLRRPRLAPMIPRRSPSSPVETARAQKGYGNYIYTPNFVSERLLMSVFNKTVLDLGCGDGHYSLKAIQHGAEQVVSVDSDARALETLHRNAQQQGIQPGKIICEHSDILAFMRQQPDNTFDVIIAFHILHYFTPAQENEFFNLCHKILKYNGQLFITALTIGAAPYADDLHVFPAIEEYIREQKKISGIHYPSFLDPLDVEKHRWKVSPSRLMHHPQDPDYLRHVLYIYGFTIEDLRTFSIISYSEFPNSVGVIATCNKQRQQKVTKLRIKTPM